MLETVDLSRSTNDKRYEKDIAELQLQLVSAHAKLRDSGKALVVMYEGWDASGKGGSILRITEKLDPRGFQVWPIGAPDVVEQAHHYLWRFWTRLPKRGQITIFDRSWYGRVLVERVEDLTREEDWRRGYREIRDFERTLVDNGIGLVKFWMHISKAEQLRRFKERESDPFKQWKIGPADWRNREKWDDYLLAAEEMLAETHTAYAPWRLIAAEDKHYARVETMRTVERALRETVER